MSVTKGTAERHVVDQAGTEWRITEVKVWDANGREKSSLIAAHERGFRRLWDFPSNWAALEDIELATLVCRPAGNARQQTTGS
ncbi:MAG: hypothetical protein ABI328_12795 [Gemmatimonadaceae bacterium]